MDPAPRTKAETPIRRYFFIACRRLPCGVQAGRRVMNETLSNDKARSARYVQPAPRVAWRALIPDLQVEFPGGSFTVPAAGRPIANRLSTILHPSDSLSLRYRLPDRLRRPVM